ncbi:MAG: hypothetical protein SO170_04980 [Butyribacter sp.]|nr:hypothetical protein [Butyribacter sp.]
MKRKYETPVMELETFVPNEYIASCYAIVDKNDSSNFTIRGNWNGKYTDGQNTKSSGKWNWNKKGFGDDHFDYLDSPTWKESHSGLFYNGSGMKHTTNVQAWEAKNDTAIGQTKVDYTATAVDLIKINKSNSDTYHCSPNAS